MLYLIYRSHGFLGNLFEAHPNQYGTAYMISNYPGLAALAFFESSNLLGFPMKLLNFPTQAAHILYDLSIILSKVVRYDIVRALGRQHLPKQFHFMVSGKTLNLYNFAMLLFWLRPFQGIHSAISLGTARIVNLAIILEWTVVHFFQFLDVKHHIFRCIPAIHQNGVELKLLLVHAVCKHVMQVIQFRLAIPIGVVDPIVYDPKLIRSRIYVHTSHHANTFDDTMRISTVLPSYQLNLERVVLVYYRVVKNNVTIVALYHLLPNIFPNQTGGNLIPGQVTVELIVAECRSVICEIGQRIVDLADKQILAVVQTSNGVFC